MIGTKILIVDDNQDDRELIRMHLKQAGFNELKIIEAGSGEEGVEKAKQEKPDIVITDTNLPQMRGFDVCKNVKEIEGLNAKVIVMTGDVVVVDAGKAKEMGADDYCVKTMEWEALIESVKKII